LNGSGRSSPQTTLVCNELAAPFSAPLAYKSSFHSNANLPLRPGQPTSAPLCPTWASTNVCNTPETTLRHDTLPNSRDELHLSGQTTGLSTVPANAHVQMRHFCVYCYEETGKRQFFGTKQDWKRHQEDYHSETGIEWHCKYEGCKNVFDRGLPFKKHLDKHPGNPKPKECKDVRQHQRLYACGFGPRCRELNENWKDFINHLSTHMMKGHSDWSYDRTIRALLKQSAVHETWKSMFGDRAFQLTWDRSNTCSLKRKLEYRQYGSNLRGFLNEVFQAGSLQYIQSPIAAPLPPPGFPLPTPPAPASSVFPNAPTLPSHSLENVGHGMPLLLSPFQFQNTEQATEEIASVPSAYRNSCSMPDFDTTSFYFDDEEVDAAHEVTGREDFTQEPTSDHYNATLPLPPLSASQDNVLPSEPRKAYSSGLLNLFNKKRFQHSQQPNVLVHPDLPPNTRMPTSHPKRTAAIYTVDSATNSYNYEL
jgi:hypothetical protein